MYLVLNILLNLFFKFHLLTFDFYIKLGPYFFWLFLFFSYPFLN